MAKFQYFLICLFYILKFPCIHGAYNYINNRAAFPDFECLRLSLASFDTITMIHWNFPWLDGLLDDCSVVITTTTTTTTR